MKKYFYSIHIVTLLFISGCSHYVQTTSGDEYLEKYASLTPGNSNESTGDDNAGFTDILKKSAQIEPTLRFPARIGLARIDNGRLSAIPEAEIEAWYETKESLGKGFGEFIPISPLIANMAAATVYQSDNYRIDNTINKVRLGAARQHLDAVLVYEVYSRSSSKSNILAIANLTIIGGYILPSKLIKAEGFANAMLIDVLQGYPYGTAQVIVDKDEISTAWGTSEHIDSIKDKVKTSAAIKLMDEIEDMFKELRWELAEKRVNS